MHRGRERGEEERCSIVSLWREAALVCLAYLLSEVRDASLLLGDGVIPFAQLPILTADGQLEPLDGGLMLCLLKHHRLLQSADAASEVSPLQLDVRQAEANGVCIDSRRLLCTDSQKLLGEAR